jgi:3-keto-L-gulonate-6-phosphate decarboxylase
MKKPWIQVSIDTQDVPAGLAQIEHAVAMDAEWVEVGTPLLTFAGIEAVGTVKSAVGDRDVLVDFKALDGVAQYFTRAGELGASVATVMAVANEASIEKAIQSGHAAGVKVQVDMLGIATDQLAVQAKRLAAMGADYFLLHLAIDELMRNPTADPLEGLDELVAATDVPVGPVVFSNDQGSDAVRRGASYVVIGHPLITEPDARERLVAFGDAVRAAGNGA